MQTSDQSAWWWRECRSGMNQTPATHRMDALDQRHRPAAVRAAVRLLSTSSSLHSSTRSPTERQSHQLDVPLTGEGKAARTSGLHSYTDGSGLGVGMPSSRDSSVARARERYIKTRTLNCVTFTRVDSEPHPRLHQPVAGSSPRLAEFRRFFNIAHETRTCGRSRVQTVTYYH